MSQSTTTDLSKIFQQYKTTIKVPVLEYLSIGGSSATAGVMLFPGFVMPLYLGVAAERYQRVRVTERWQSTASSLPSTSELRVNPV